MIRVFFGAILGLFALILLVTTAIGEVPPPNHTTLALDAHAYTLQFIPRAKAPDPKPSRPPKRRPPRVKHSIERFSRFEFDQRSIA